MHLHVGTSQAVCEMSDAGLVNCCWKEVAPLLMLIPADTFVVSHVGLALGIAPLR